MMDLNHQPVPSKSDEHKADTASTARYEISEIFCYERLDSEQMAARLNVPESWVRDQVRARAEDPLPHIQFGKYVRFLWGSPELEAWLRRRIIVPNNKRVGRVH